MTFMVCALTLALQLPAMAQPATFAPRLLYQRVVAELAREGLDLRQQGADLTLTRTRGTTWRLILDMRDGSALRRTVSLPHDIDAATATVTTIVAVAVAAQPSGRRATVARNTGRRVLEFDAQEIQGTTVGPEGQVFFYRKQLKHNSMIHVRDNFTLEILRTAEDLL